MLPCFHVPSTIQTGMAARDGLFEPREKTKNLASALFRGLRLCNPLKSHKIAKGFFGNPWQKQAEIWKCLEKKLGGGQTRPGDAGPPNFCLVAPSFRQGEAIAAHSGPGRPRHRSSAPACVPAGK